MRSRFTPANLLGSLVAALVMTHAAPGHAAQTVGLFVNAPGAYDGYTLFTPLSSRVTYLINNEGELVHVWQTEHVPGNTQYLMPNGNLIRTADPQPPASTLMVAGGDAGLVQEFDWDGNLLWEFPLNDETQRAHHDIEVMPNGNILMIAWEYKTMEEAVAAGRDPATLGQADGSLWPDKVIEIEKVGTNSANVVWEWHSWDHLVQDFSAASDNFGVVADHPERIDINFRRNNNGDWHHANAIDYNPTLDHIMLSIPFFNEIWIIDHSTTTQEAAGHTGGNSGMGGDLIYRWGNPLAYRGGTADDQTLYFQHSSHWIEPGLDGAGNILVYNNGRDRPGGSYSSIDEIVPPLDASGNYTNNVGATTFGPDAAAWTYFADPPESMYSSGLSGAQRLPNGNTLICVGRDGAFIEVTTDGDVVWRYINPVGTGGPSYQGDLVTGRAVFRATRFPLDHPAFAGRDLTPQGQVELDPDADEMDGLSLTVTPDGIVVRWNSLPGETYRVQYRPTLDPLDPWVDIGMRTAIGTSTTFLDSRPGIIAQPSGFYQIVK